MRTDVQDSETFRSKLNFSDATTHPISTIKTNTQAYAKAFLLNQMDFPFLNCSTDSIFCVAPVANNRTMALFDINRINPRTSTSGVLTFGEIRLPRSLLFIDCIRNSDPFCVDCIQCPSSCDSSISSTSSPGWVAGGSHMPLVNPFYCLLSYQSYGGR